MAIMSFAEVSLRLLFRLLLTAALVASLTAIASGCSPGGEEADTSDTTDSISRSLWQDLLTDVSFRGTTGVVSGWGGRILRTTDGGQSWVEIDSGTKTDLNSVAFLTDSVAVAVGSGGKILRSTDAGATWTSLESPTGETLNGIVDTGAGTALAAGWNGTVLSSVDDGASWTASTFDFPNNYISLDYWEGVTMMVSSGGFAYRSFDGVVWEPLKLPEEVTPAAVGLGPGSSAMLVGEYGEMLTSNNVGSDWYESAGVNTADLLCVAFVGNGQNAVAGGWDGVLLRTADGGASWATLTSGTMMTIRAIDVVDSNNIFAVGDGGTIIGSGDGGFTWLVLREAEEQ